MVQKRNLGDGPSWLNECYKEGEGEREGWRIAVARDITNSWIMIIIINKNFYKNSARLGQSARISVRNSAKNRAQIPLWVIREVWEKLKWTPTGEGGRKVRSVRKNTVKFGIMLTILTRTTLDLSRAVFFSFEFDESPRISVEWFAITSNFGSLWLTYLVEGIHFLWAVGLNWDLIPQLFGGLSSRFPKKYHSNN